MASREIIITVLALGLAACGESDLDMWCDHIWQVRADCGGCGTPDQSEFIDECAVAMLQVEMSDGAARSAFQCAGVADTCGAIRECLAPTRLSITSRGIEVHRF